MAIPLEEYREPKWQRYKTRYPMSENKKDRFMKFDDRNPAALRSYRGEEGFKQAGYEPNHGSTRIEHINMEADEFTLKKR